VYFSQISPLYKSLCQVNLTKSSPEMCICYHC